MVDIYFNYYGIWVFLAISCSAVHIFCICSLNQFIFERIDKSEIFFLYHFTNGQIIFYFWQLDVLLKFLTNVWIFKYINQWTNWFLVWFIFWHCFEMKSFKTMLFIIPLVPTLSQKMEWIQVSDHIFSNCIVLLGSLYHVYFKSCGKAWNSGKASICLFIVRKQTSISSF